MTHTIEWTDDDMSVHYKKPTEEEYRQWLREDEEDDKGVVLADYPQRHTDSPIPTDEEAAWMGEGWSIDDDGDRFDPYDFDGFGDD